MKLSASLLFLLPFLTRPSEGHKAEEDGYISFGLALNGGSFTAANGCASAMRGFQQQQITRDGKDRPAMEAFDLISGLSGGNMPNVQYHYTRNTNSDELLDASGINDPAKITFGELDSIPMKSMFSRYSSSHFPSIVLAAFTAKFYSVPLWPELIFSLLLGRDATVFDAKIRDGVVSTPLIEASMVGPVDVFPDWIDKRMNRGVFNEYNNKLTSLFDGGLVLFEGFESSLAKNNDVMLELVKKHSYQIPLPTYGTHDTLHVPFLSEVRIEFDEVGNMTAEPLNFKPVAASYAEVSSDGNPFTLKTLLGMGTDTLILDYTKRFLLGALLLPFDPITADIPTSKDETREMVFTDGGYNDGTGIPGLVTQKTKNIISINCPSPDAVNATKASVSAYVRYNFGPFFGYKFPANPDYFTAANGPLNHMFNLNSNGEDQEQKLRDAFLSLQAAGEPMITTLTDLEVIDNPFWGITGGWKLDLTIALFIGVPKKFAEKIPEGIVTNPDGRPILDELGFFSKTEFKSVPNVAGQSVPYQIPTLGSEEATQVPGLLPLMPVRAARMTQIMLSWAIEHAWDGLEVDGEVKFGGFRKIFEEETVTSSPNKAPKMKKALKHSKRGKSKKTKRVLNQH